MFSLSDPKKENSKMPICKIVGGKYNNKIVYLNGKKTNKLKEDEIEFEDFDYLKLNDGKFEIYPNTAGDRTVVSFLGPSGVGKSYSMKTFMKRYEELYKLPIYLFSRKMSDVTLNDVRSIQRVKIDYSLVTNPIDYKEFENSCVVFDDIDGLPDVTKQDKLIKHAVNSLKNQILELARDIHTSCLVSSHLAAKGFETRTLINESHLTLIYPSSGSPYQSFLKRYFDFSPAQIERIVNFDSRWVCMTRSYPRVLFTENEIMPLKDL
jgi:hypothetical protein